MEALMVKVSKLDEGDVLVFSGNAPVYLLDNVDEMIKDCALRNVKIVLDTNSNIMKRCLGYKPFLIRPSIEEIEEILEEKIDYKKMEDLFEPCKKLLELGAVNIIVQLGEEGSILCCKEGIYHTDLVSEEKIINTVGEADSIVAGFIMNSLRTPDVVDSFRFASCCGIATTFSKGLATRDKVNELYKVVQVNKVD